MIRTFIDAGTLIAGARGEEPISQRAMLVLDDPQREFASSALLKLEVLPNAQYNQRKEEAAFYEAFFDAVTYWADDWQTIIEEANALAARYGVGPMDALHIAAALSVQATEFVTAERADKSLFRTNVIKVVSIRPETAPENKK